MAETDISRSLVAVEREFQSHIDFIRDYINLDVSVESKLNYAHCLKNCLEGCHEIYKVLIDEHRRIHREYINSRCP